MIYLDSSVALAHLLAEDRHPPDALWRESLVSSRLLEYELLTRLARERLTESHSEAASDILRRVAMVELAVPVVQRVRQPFPVPVRTLDALHLASLEFLREQGVKVALASYDSRQLEVARRMGIRLYEL